jgi:hypothetical protein
MSLFVCLRILSGYRLSWTAVIVLGPSIGLSLILSVWTSVKIAEDIAQNTPLIEEPSVETTENTKTDVQTDNINDKPIDGKIMINYTTQK